MISSEPQNHIFRFNLQWRMLAVVQNKLWLYSWSSNNNNLKKKKTILKAIAWEKKTGTVQWGETGDSNVKHCGRSIYMHSQTGSVTNRQVSLKLAKMMIKTKVIWNSTEVFKKKTFLIAFPTKMQQIGETGFSVSFLSYFLNELLNSN